MEQDDEVKVTFSQQDDVKDKLDTLKKLITVSLILYRQLSNLLILCKYTFILT